MVMAQPWEPRLGETSMDLHRANMTLLSENEKLRKENEHLKLLQSLVKENVDLRTKSHVSSDDTVHEATGLATATQWQGTMDESHFRKDLQRSEIKHAHKTSSPISFQCYNQSSVQMDTGAKAKSQSSQPDVSCRFKDPERLLGEIAFQLDRRILSHVFQGQKRLYGFTMPNIQDKIIQVSTQPLTGRVDNGYRLHLSQRYTDLMDRLNPFGYSPTLHPTFGEFIINSYGILMERPASQTSQDIDLSDPDVLTQVIINTAPGKLLKDLLILLSCLCYMAKNDGKPLFYW